MKYKIFVFVTFLFAVSLFVEANNIEDDLKCFVSGQCTNTENLDILSVDDEFKCLDECHNLSKCTWFTFNPESKSCVLFSNCVKIDESSCPLCLSGQRECPDPVCWVQGMLLVHAFMTFLGNFKNFKLP